MGRALLVGLIAPGATQVVRTAPKDVAYRCC